MTIKAVNGVIVPATVPSQTLDRRRRRPRDRSRQRSVPPESRPPSQQGKVGEPYSQGRSSIVRVPGEVSNKGMLCC